MNNFEWLKSQEDLKSLGHKLCDLMDDAENDGLYGCDICPVNSLCERDKNGFITWLEAEMDKHRRNNIADMTISEQFESIKEQMCDEYCRFPELSRETHEDPDDAFEWLQHTYCEHCPLGRL